MSDTTNKTNSHKFELAEVDLNNLKQLLYNKQDEIILLKDKIRIAEKNLCYLCSLEGHNMVRERENGMYGDTYTYCTKCNYHN